MPSKKGSRGRPRNISASDPEDKMPLIKKHVGRHRNVSESDPDEMIDPFSKIEVFNINEIANDSKEIEMYKKEIWKMKQENELLIEENRKLKDLNLDLQYDMKILKEKMMEPNTQIKQSTAHKNTPPAPQVDPVTEDDDITDAAMLERVCYSSDSSPPRRVLSSSESSSPRRELSITDDSELESEFTKEEIPLLFLADENFVEPTNTEGNITLSAEKEFALKSIPNGEKDDSKFVNLLLVSLYPQSELRNRSVKGQPARNGKTKGMQKRRISQDKLLYISSRMRERVEQSDGTVEEKEARARQSNVRSLINKKLQYICKSKSGSLSVYNTQESLIKMEEIQLSKQRETMLNNISSSPKDDGKFINCLLLGLYTQEELKKLSVTGKSSRNTKMTQTVKQPICPHKLLYIYNRVDQRVDASDCSFEEKELRKKRPNIKLRINQKLQYITKHARAVMNRTAMEEREEVDEVIKISHKNEILLSNISMDSKDDSKFVRQLLVSMYKPEELVNLSVTGKATNNPKHTQHIKNCISPAKLLYIIRKSTAPLFFS